MPHLQLRIKQGIRTVGKQKAVMSVSYLDQQQAPRAWSVNSSYRLSTRETAIARRRYETGSRAQRRRKWRAGNRAATRSKVLGDQRATNGAMTVEKSLGQDNRIVLSSRECVGITSVTAENKGPVFQIQVQ